MNYLRYFLFIAWNWGPVLALFIIYYEIRGERKYHIRTVGEDTLKSLKKKGIDISHAHIYMPVNYYILECLMKEISRYPHNKTFLDLGCGKGRAMVAAAVFGFERISGVDISAGFCEEALVAITHYRHGKTNACFTLVTGDAALYEIPPEITTIFLFNPFDEIIIGRVISNILKSLRIAPRTIRILYANPEHKMAFIKRGFSEIYHIKKLNYFEGIILEYAS